jgi:hypothetical protein
VTFQLIGVLAGIAAEAALEGTLARVGADVAFQFAGLGHMGDRNSAQAGASVRQLHRRGLS